MKKFISGDKYKENQDFRNETQPSFIPGKKINFVKYAKRKADSYFKLSAVIVSIALILGILLNPLFAIVGSGISYFFYKLILARPEVETSLIAQKINLLRWGIRIVAILGIITFISIMIKQYVF